MQEVDLNGVYGLHSTKVYNGNLLKWLKAMEAVNDRFECFHILFAKLSPEVWLEEEYLEKLNSEFNMDPNDVRESVYKKFNREVILKQYEDLFINIVTN